MAILLNQMFGEEVLLVEYTAVPWYVVMAIWHKSNERSIFSQGLS